MIEIIQKPNLIEIKKIPIEVDVVITRPIINIFKAGVHVSGDALWEVDGSEHIKPKFDKKINTIHLDGEIFGGIFQP